MQLEVNVVCPFEQKKGICAHVFKIIYFLGELRNYTLKRYFFKGDNK